MAQEINALLLSRFSEIDGFVFDFLKKMSEKIELNVTVLSVVNSYPEIPLNEDGSIISYCTEYDVSPLEKSKSDREEKAQVLQNNNSFIKSVKVVIGRLDRVIENELVNHNFQVALMGAAPTNFFEDYFVTTKIESVINQSSTIPVLSLKCDRSFEDTIENIGVFSPFDDNNSPGIKLISTISNAFESKVHLYMFMDELTELSEKNANEKLKNLASENNLKTAIIHLMDKSIDKEHVIKNQLTEDSLQMIAVSNLERNSFGALYPTNLKTAIANHVMSPILIY